MKKKLTAALILSAVLVFFLSGCQMDGPAVSGKDTSGGFGSALFEKQTERPHNERAIPNGTEFPSMTNLRSEEYEDGTYWYEDMGDNRDTLVVNRSFPTDPGMRAEKDYAREVLYTYVSEDVRNIDVIPAGEECAIGASMDACYVYWTLGEGRAARNSVGLLATGENYTYLYSFTAEPKRFDSLHMFYMEFLQTAQLLPREDADLK